MTREARLQLPPTWADAPRLVVVVDRLIAAVDTVCLWAEVRPSDRGGSPFVAPPLFVYGTGTSVDPASGLDRARVTQAHVFAGRLDVSGLRDVLSRDTTEIVVTLRVEDRDGHDLDPSVISADSAEIALVAER